MSERVSDEFLRMWTADLHDGSGTAKMARELLAWRSLGESPEAVRLILDNYRSAAVRDAMERPAYPAPRPSFAEALEDAFRGYAMRSSQSMGDREAAVTLWELVRQARRAAGEVL